MNVIPFNVNAPEPGSSLDYALKYAAIGWHVFPVWGAKDGRCRCGGLCKSPGKHPVEHLAPRGQTDATTDATTVRRWWAQMPEAGIAVNLRPSDLVAIDIDPRNGGFLTMEQIEAAHGPMVSDVLAFTQGGGEHRVFLLNAEINLPGKLGPGVDVKRNGYIVIEPTRGPLGVYAWEASSNPLEGAIPSPLPDWMRSLATVQAPDFEATVASRYVTEAQIVELRDALAVLPSDDRDTWVRYGLALCPLGQAGFDLWDAWSRKSAKYDPVDSIRVWRSFKPGTINFESIFFEAQQCGWVNPLAGGAPPPVPVESVKLAIKPTEPVPVSFKLPGILGAVEDWINATSRKPQPLFSTQAALAFAATVMGRRYVTPQRNWPSLYFLNIGKSASGKEHAKWAIETLLDACNLGKLIGPAGYTSDSGVLSSLHRNPAHVAIIDEFGKILEAASIKHGARAASTLRALMEAWGRCDGVIRPQGYSTFGMSAQDADKMEQRSIRNPALTLLAMTTPESFFDSVGSSAARDGFLNRFLIVESDIGRQAGRHVDAPDVPESVIDWATDTHSVETGIATGADMTPAPKVVPFSRAALQAFKDFEHECIALMDAYEADGLAEMFGRSNEIAMRVSLIVATGCQSPVIESDHAEWAIQYVRQHALRTTERLKVSVADSEFESVKKQVLDKIIKAGERGMAEWEIDKSCHLFRALNQRGQMDVLNSLAFVSKIQRVEIPRVRGPKRTAWVAISIEQMEADE
jgi:hypothetical protein